MKIRRFAGPDMRVAMRQVRETLGADAVILETKRTATGVEISAAAEHASGASESAPAMSARAPGTLLDATDGDDGDCVSVGAERQAGRASWQPPRQAGAAADLERVREEVRSIRSLLEAQVTRLIWDDETRRTPETAALLRNYAQLGLEPDIARRLSLIADGSEGRGSWSAGLRALVEQVPVADRDLADEGGIIAIVGPTGVGKTTTIAKLAARAAMQRGPDSVGLVTTDTFRVAAREQLDTFGQILGVHVHQVADSQGLVEALRELRDRRLVLVDTAGMSQRDPRLAEHLASLAGVDARVATLLALPANVQAGALQEIVDVFRTAAPVAGILTKTDEAASLGGALSVLIRSGLPLAYVTNGQRVPEDLHLMRDRQAWLAKMAVELMRREDRAIGEEQMAQRYTEVAVHAYA
jgi:flagellar biosynthesis protein FlhF